MSNWEILGIEPTYDTRAIKRAYAAQSKLHHPETDPEGFQALYGAYQWALERAKTRQPQADQRQISRSMNKAVTKYGSGSNPSSRKPRPRFPAFSGSAFDVPAPVLPAARHTDSGIDFDGIFGEVQAKQEEQVRSCAALQTFMQMFGDHKKRDSRGYWQEYFFSDVFLGMQHDPQFIAMLVDFLETQRELPAYLLPRLLCVGLYTAYSLAPAQALPGGMGRMHPLVRLLESQRDSEQIQKQLMQEEFLARQAAFRIYNQLVGLYPDRLQKNEWESLLRFTDAPNLHAGYTGKRMVKRPPEFFALLAFFVTSHPDLPQEFLAYLYKLYHFKYFGRSSTKVDARPLYLALQDRLE